MSMKVRLYLPQYNYRLINYIMKIPRVLPTINPNPCMSHDTHMVHVHVLNKRQVIRVSTRYKKDYIFSSLVPRPSPLCTKIIFVKINACVS